MQVYIVIHVHAYNINAFKSEFVRNVHIKFMLIEVIGFSGSLLASRLVSLGIKCVKLWDFSGYYERTTSGSKRPTRQKLAFQGKLSSRY